MFSDQTRTGSETHSEEITCMGEMKREVITLKVEVK